MFREEIDAILNSLYNENPNITAVIAASKDGLLVNTRPALVNHENIGGTVAAMSAVILGAAEMLSAIRLPLVAGNRRAGAVEGGVLKEVLLTGKWIQMVIIDAGPQNLLLVYTNKSEIDGILLQAIRDSAEKILKVTPNFKG